MEYPFSFIEYTNTEDPNVSIISRRSYHYHGRVRDGITEDMIYIVKNHIIGDIGIVERRIRDYMDMIMLHQSNDYIHVELYIECPGEVLDEYHWHYDYSYGNRFLAAIVGDRTVFLIPNEYNKGIMNSHDIGNEAIDLNDAFKNEEKRSSLSNEMSIFDASEQLAIHSSPNTSGSRILMCSIFGSYSQVYNDSINEGEDRNWSKLSYEYDV